MAGPRAVSLIELASEIAGVVGAPSPALKLPKALVWAGCYALETGFSLIGREAPFTRRSMKFFTGNTSFCTKKAEQLLGFRAVTDLPEGVRKTRQWLLESEL
jgi:nucleoside-diphosphate-sugar epimerase